MSVDKQTILHDLNLKQACQSSHCSTPVMFSRDSSMETLSSFNVNFHSHNSTYTSEHSTNPSGILSPSDIPDSPPRGCDDDIDAMQQRTSIQLLDNTGSTGRTITERPAQFMYDDNDVDSVRNYATSPCVISYDDDNDDDRSSIHSSLSSLTLPPPPSSSTAAAVTSIDDIRNLKHNLSVINEESLHEQHERRKSSAHMSHAITDEDDEDDDDDEDDQKGKRLLFELIRQRLPHHHTSLSSTSNSSKPNHEGDRQQTKSLSTSSSSSVNDQTMREDSSTQGVSSHDITIPSSVMQESGYDSLLPAGSSGPKRSLSNASISTTRSITLKKKHRCDEENDDPMNGHSNTDFTDDDDDDHYDKKAGEALLRNLIAQVLPSFNPRYLNGDDDDDDDEIMSNPRRPSPTSQAHSSSNASSIRSLDIDIDLNKRSEKNFSIHSTKTHKTEIIQQEKIHSKRSYIHKPVHQTKTSELRRLQTHSRR